MLLTIDVGNTNTVLGVFEGDSLRAHWRLTTRPEQTADEYGILVRNLFSTSGLDPAGISAVALASVVPPLTPVLIALARQYLGHEPLVVGPGVRTGMPILYEPPGDVGADRIVNGVAAFAAYGGPVIVVDFGTATTFDCISPKGEYLGGVIVPGVQVSLDGLLARAAKLTRVELAAPPHVLGRNTTHALQSGVVFGYASMIDGMVARLEAELGYPCHIMATGGLSTLIAKHTTRIQEVDVNLTLDGLCLLHERNASAVEAAEASAAKRRAERTR